MTETLEQFAERICPNKQIEYDMIIEGAKWQQERSYSEEEVLELLNDWTEASKEWGLVSKWFEQFKKIK